MGIGLLVREELAGGKSETPGWESLPAAIN
jgi:hypothetical protein